MLLFNRNLDSEVVVVAEVGINHSGSLDWILNFLPKLKHTDVDAVKFQLFTPKYHTSIKDKARFSFLEKRALSEKEFRIILERCKDLSLPCFATPVTPDWVDFVSQECSVIKIASGDFTFLPITKRSLNSPAKLIASTGGSTMSEIEDFTRLAKSTRGEKYAIESIALLHCVSSYPPPIEESNLNAIPAIRAATGLTVGFSTHFMEDSPLYAALALGARIFEIHVTDDRGRSDIRDHALSRTPDEMLHIVANLRDLNESLKVKTKMIQLSESGSINAMRKGLVFSKNFSEGHIISIEDFSYARPFNPNIPPASELIGLKLKRDVLAFYPVEVEDFEFQVI